MASLAAHLHARCQSASCRARAGQRGDERDGPRATRLKEQFLPLQPPRVVVSYDAHGRATSAVSAMRYSLACASYATRYAVGKNPDNGYSAGVGIGTTTSGCVNR